MEVSVQFDKIIYLQEEGGNDGCDDDVCDRWWEGVGGEINYLIFEEKNNPKKFIEKISCYPRNNI